MPRQKHNHYFKATPYSHVDVYRVLELFDVTDPCLQHAVKKLLVSGGRAGAKSRDHDIQDAIDSLVRWQEMRAEDVRAAEVEAAHQALARAERKRPAEPCDVCGDEAVAAGDAMRLCGYHRNRSTP